MKVKFNDWFYGRKDGKTPASSAWSTLSVAFAQGDSLEQDEAIFQIMKEVWDARYETLTYEDI